MKKRKTPLRKCVSCQERSDKKTLVRIVKTKEGEVFLDPSGKANGRGAYICSLECLEDAIKKKALSRAFGIEISDETYEKLREDLKKHGK
ncbi:hypothetical protein SAMN02745945_00424 [Peptoclostridium litorale DSM 5388]|uniref:YlxR domain-containing protein n=1 Tax=Peptoclostridium litorale DSM 5388 TaxID=1121324 RepID=A0A069RGB9_PEPLI|nr:YlxR family protein [Peptoclostridium litorale]KDR95205.1 hypothetical protein CLIT_11c02340 [Peptoclostridium litorale DSM 5388]SIN73405.1 hypothetical protein SAMN02745945_00424 [Peptoclostridium litorale DSM 5388]